jgi:hypothetical protein
VEVTDDVGTSYRGHGFGASSDIEAGRYISKWTTTFTPGMPAQAQTLTVRGRRRAVRLRRDGRGGSPGGVSCVPQPVSVAAMLCRELSGAAGGPPLVKLSAEDPFLDGYVASGRVARSQYPYGQGMLLALETLGLLTSEQTAAWSRRFDLAAEGWSPGPAAGREQRDLAEDHLRRLVASLHEATDTHAHRALLDRLNGAFSFCLQTGLVDPTDAPEWGTSVEEALGETLEQFETTEAEEGLDPDELSELQDVDEPEFRPPESMGALVGVVPAEPARHEGWCITAVALHQRGFEVHWHALGNEPYGPDGSLDVERFEAADDLGIEYRATGAGGSFSSYSERQGTFAMLGQSDCAPTVREGARELRVRRAGSEWVARLT